MPALDAWHTPGARATRARMSDTQTESPETPDPLLDRAATLADIAAHWDTLLDKPGLVVEARVEAVDASTVTVALASGHARVPAAEFGDSPPAPGATVRVFVEQVLADGPRVSRLKAAGLDLWDAIDDAGRADRGIEGRVVARMQGGLSVALSVGDAPPLKAFLPEKRADAPLGVTGTFFVREWDDRKALFVLSREPGALREARKARREAVRAVETDGGPEAAPSAPRAPVTLPEVGAELEGLVVRLANFGAFVDLPGGATGLLHAKEMSHGRGTNPGDFVKVGETVKVKVLGIDGDRIQLSRKVFLADPWESASTRLAVGQRLQGKVIGFTDIGAFVEIEPGVEAFVHVSELRWGAAPKHPKDVVKGGDAVEGEVILFDAAKRHLKLSLRKLQPAPVDTLRTRFPVGSKVTGKVKNVASFGVFVILDEATGLEGLVHVSDLSWDPGARANDLVKPGAPIEALVLGIDEERGRASLGVKQLLPEPERPSLEGFGVGHTQSGRIARVKDFGAFVELAPGVEGLLHANEMRLGPGQKPRSKFKPGDAVEVVVTSSDVAARKLGLGLVAEAPGAPEATEPTPES